MLPTPNLNDIYFNLRAAAESLTSAEERLSSITRDLLGPAEVAGTASLAKAEPNGFLENLEATQREISERIVDIHNQITTLKSALYGESVSKSEHSIDEESPVKPSRRRG